MIKKERVVTVEGLRDGKGSVEIHHILEGEDLMGHGTMFARVIGMSAIQSPITSSRVLVPSWITTAQKQRYIPAMSAPSRLVNGMPWKTIPMKIWK